MLEIDCGTPWAGEPASYSRFVLPFAYHPERLTPADLRGPHFVHVAPENLAARSKYLTEETSNALFRRAQWLTLDATSMQWPVTRSMRFHDGQTLKICIAPPSIVLFEWPASNRRDADPPELDLLQIGFLMVDLHFSPEANHLANLDHLLELNELFRYWQQPYLKHRAEFATRLNSDLFLPIVTNGNPPEPMANADSSSAASTDPYFDRWASLLDLPLTDRTGQPWRLFPEHWSADARSWIAYSSPQSVDKGHGWAVYADNRTYVWTCAIANEGGNALRKCFGRPNSHAHEFGHWIKLLNVDRPAETTEKTGNSRQFERDWAKERTYGRWEESGTFYGFSYHSGAMLGPPFKDLPLWQHFARNYFDQTLLLLYLRVAIFRFSHELSRISSVARDTKEKNAQERWLKNFQSLRWSFALFTNLYQFPLLSNQQQAIEMYSLARKSMDVDELFKEIQEEIENCHDYSVVQETVQLTRTTTFLSVLAAFGLTLALTISFFSMDIFKVGGARNFSNLYFDGLGTVIFVMVLLVFVLGSMATIAFSPFLLRRIYKLIDCTEHLVEKWKSPKSKRRRESHS